MHEKNSSKNIPDTTKSEEALSVDELKNVSGGKRITSVSKMFLCKSCGWRGMVTTYTNGTIADCPKCHYNNWQKWDDTSSEW